MDKPVNALNLVLCTCNKKISSRLDLHKLADLFEKRKIQVAITDKLCEDWTPLEDMARQSKQAGFVVGACSDEIFLSNLREKLNQHGADEFSTSTVDLLGQAELDLDQATNTELASLLLQGLLEKAKIYPGVSPENLKPYWFRSGEKMSRRKLFSIPKIRYNLVPSIEKSKCVAWKDCYLCFTACPVKACTKEKDVADIDKNICTGCGACVAVCPSRCITYPVFTFPELEAQLETMMDPVNISDKNSPEGSSPLPEGGKAVAFICSPAQSLFQDILKKNSTLAAGVIPVHLPCLALASPYLIMKALSSGASSVVLFACESGCPMGIDPKKIENNVREVQALVKALGTTGKNVHHICRDDVGRLTGVIGNVIKGPVTPKLPVLSGKFGEMKGRLGTLLAALGSELGKQGIADLDSIKVSLGKVKIDPDKCTFCELCAAHCPTEALKLEQGDKLSRILFSYRDCIACNLCLKFCPEREKGAIEVQRSLDWDALKNEAGDVLVESKQVCCSKCGIPIANSLMIERIKKKLGPGATTAFDLCSQCRFQAALFKNDST